MRIASTFHRLAPLPLMLGMLVACGPKAPMEDGSTTPTINLFGFEESELHHIHNTVELHRSIFLVHYDPKVPDRIEWVNCPIAADYTYRKANGRRVESIEVHNSAELRARVPVNYARFEGRIKAEKGMQFNYVTIGSYELMSIDFSIPADDPDCQRATHYVTTLSVGAFNYGKMVEVGGELDVAVAGTGAGGGIAGGHGSGELTSMGDLEACMEDGTAFNNCFTPLQIRMEPLATRHWSTGDTEAAASGTGTSTGSRPSDAASEPQEAQGLALRVDAEAWRPGSFMAMALENVLVTAARIDMTTDFGFDDKGATVAAGYLSGQGDVRQFSRPLEAGRTYAVFATGAVETNLDLKITDEAGNVLAADTEADGHPALTFVPPADGIYGIALEQAGAGENFGALVVMQDGGLQVDVEVLQGVFQRLLDAGTFASAKVQEMGHPAGLSFHIQDWAVQGTILYPGEAIRQRGIRLDPVSAVFSAVSHDETMNIDLEVIDANSGQNWVDAEPDSNPIVIVHEPDPNTTYDLRVVYGEGESATLATSMILRLSD